MAPPKAARAGARQALLRSLTLSTCGWLRAEGSGIREELLVPRSRGLDDVSELRPGTDRPSVILTYFRLPMA